MCTDLQKKIYNEHLKESRKSKNLPFRIRKNFEKLDSTTKLCLQKLEKFFVKHKDVSINDFFKAGYFVYPNDEYINLKFFTTLKAINAYKIYKNSPNNS